MAPPLGLDPVLSGYDPTDPRNKPLFPRLPGTAPGIAIPLGPAQNVQAKPDLGLMADSPSTELGPRRPTPLEDRYESLAQQGPPQLHGAKKFLDILGQVTKPGRAIESAIPGSTGYYNRELGAAKNAAEQESELGARQAQEDYQKYEMGKPQTVESGGVAYELGPLGNWQQIGEPKPQPEVKPDWHPVTGTNLEVNATSPTGEAQQIPGMGAPPAKEPRNPIAGTVNGKMTYAYPSPDGKGFLDANTGAKLNNFDPQPNYGQVAAGIRTANIIDEDPNSPTYGMPIDVTLSGRKIGVSATGAYGHEAAQAGAIQRAGAGLISDIQANKSQLGTLSAWVKKYGLNTPIADPKLAQLQAELSTFAALQPAMHGFRGSNAIDTFNNIIGGLQKNPDATIASIQGILKTAGAINPAQRQGNARTTGGNGTDPLGIR